MLPAGAFLRLGTIEAVVEEDGPLNPREIVLQRDPQRVSPLKRHPCVFEHHREVICQMFRAAEAVGTRADTTEAPNVQRLGIDDALGAVVLCPGGGGDGTIAVERQRRREQIRISASQCGPAKPALVLRHEVAPHPAAEVGGDGAAFGDGQFVVVVSGDSAGFVVGGEDPAVEQQRQFAAAVAGKHVAEELVVATDQPAGIVRPGGRVDEDVRARPELGPAIKLFGAGRLAAGRGECGVRNGQPLLRIAVELRAEPHRNRVCRTHGCAAGPCLAVPELPLHGRFHGFGQTAIHNRGTAENSPGGGVIHRLGRNPLPPGLADYIHAEIGVAVIPHEPISIGLDVVR